jgi:hypothetical protein
MSPLNFCILHKKIWNPSQEEYNKTETINARGVDWGTKHLNKIFRGHENISRDRGRFAILNVVP